MWEKPLPCNKNHITKSVAAEMGRNRTQQCSLVHELLGDAANVDTGAPQAPGGAKRGGLDEV